jgi:uncharacterized protein YcbX
MNAVVAALYRHPVKGFTPERLVRADLAAGETFPNDRRYAVEVGPSGYDPAAPVFISKTKFTVLAKIAKMAQARTRFDDATGIFSVRADGMDDLDADLDAETGRAAFEAWLTDFLGEEARGPLRVVAGVGSHRFTDHPQGHVSLINLASVRELSARIGDDLDPLRFRGNVYVEGWPAWAEMEMVGRAVSLGGVEARVLKTIVRCAATHVDPARGVRDIDLLAALHTHYGHPCFGLYLNVERGGALAEGDAVALG